MLPQYSRAQFRHERVRVGQRIRQYIVRLFHDLSGGWIGQPFALAELEFSQHQYLLQVIVQVGRQPLPLPLFGKIQFRRQRAQASLRLEQFGSFEMNGLLEFDVPALQPLLRSAQGLFSPSPLRDFFVTGKELSWPRV